MSPWKIQLDMKYVFTKSVSREEARLEINKKVIAFCSCFCVFSREPAPKLDETQHQNKSFDHHFKCYGNHTVTKCGRKHFRHHWESISVEEAS